MRHTSGQKLGTLFIPLFLFGILAGVVLGAIAGSAMSVHSIIQAANDPELWAGWGPWGYGLIPVIYGMAVGGVVAVIPAIGAFLSLFIHSGCVPLPSVNQQAVAACWGATIASVIPAAILVLSIGEGYTTTIAIGAGFILVSSCITFLIARKYLHYLVTRDEATIRVTRERSASH
jgi:hypothetical protein